MKKKVVSLIIWQRFGILTPIGAQKHDRTLVNKLSFTILLSLSFDLIDNFLSSFLPFITIGSNRQYRANRNVTTIVNNACKAIIATLNYIFGYAQLNNKDMLIMVRMNEWLVPSKSTINRITLIMFALLFTSNICHVTNGNSTNDQDDVHLDHQSRKDYTK